ncbi:MAG: hypothetical protein GY940_29245 [bacterium]|nr:hypothetical protein [bacterium]
MKCTIKQTAIFILLVFIFSSSMMVSAKSFTFVIGGNYLSIANEDYETDYGKKKYFPEGKLTLRFTGNLYLWGSFGLLRSKNTWTQWSNKGIPEADVDGKSIADKTVIAGGLGFYVGYIQPGQFSIKLEAGVCSITDDIEDTVSFIDTSQVIGVINKKMSGVGFKGNFGITYGLFKDIFMEFSVGYLYASDKIDDNRVNLGGLRASLGIGLKF